MCACTFGRHHRNDPTRSLPPALCAWGGRATRLRLNVAGCGPTLLQRFASRRSTWGTSCCLSAAVEGVGWAWDLVIFFGTRTAGEGWGPRQTRAACHTFGQARVQILHAWAPRHCEVARASATRAIGAVVVRVLTAGQLASAGLVGHLLLRRVRGGRVGRGAGAISLRTSFQTGGSYTATGSVGGLGSTQIQAEPGESHGRGATSLPTVKYPAGRLQVCEFMCE